MIIFANDVIIHLVNGVDDWTQVLKIILLNLKSIHQNHPIKMSLGCWKLTNQLYLCFQSFQKSITIDKIEIISFQFSNIH